MSSNPYDNILSGAFTKDDTSPYDSILSGAFTPPKAKSPYDDIITGAAQAHGLDPDLIRATMRQESTFKPKATSNKGAAGLMQLMPETAKTLGVKNIYDPKENIYGGAKYLKQQLDRFGGDVPKALAAYNAGPGAVIKYKGVPPYKETQDYVKRITGNYKGGGYAQSDPYADILSGAFDIPQQPQPPTNPANVMVQPQALPTQTAPQPTQIEGMAPIEAPSAYPQGMPAEQPITPQQAVTPPAQQNAVVAPVNAQNAPVDEEAAKANALMQQQTQAKVANIQKVLKPSAKQGKQYEFQKTGTLTLPPIMGQSAGEVLTYQPDAELEKGGEYKVTDADGNSYTYVPSTGKIAPEAGGAILRDVAVPLGDPNANVNTVKQTQGATIASAIADMLPDVPQQDIVDFFEKKGLSHFDTQQNLTDPEYLKGFVNPVTGTTDAPTTVPYHVTQRGLNQIEAYAKDKADERAKYNDAYKQAVSEGDDPFTASISAKVATNQISAKKGDEIIAAQRPNSPENLRAMAIAAIRQENAPTMGSGKTDAHSNFGEKYEPTEDEIKAKVAELGSPEAIASRERIQQDAANIAANLKSDGLLGQAKLGLQAFGGNLEALAGAALRPFSSVPGLSDLYKTATEKSQARAIAFEHGGDNTWAGFGLRHGVKVAGDLVELALLSKVPGLKGNMPLTFAVQGAATTAGQGGSAVDTTKAFTSGYVLGKIFDGATKAESLVANVGKKAVVTEEVGNNAFLNNIWKGLSQEEKDAQIALMKDTTMSTADKRFLLLNNLVSKMAGGTVIVGGTAGLGKAEGNSNASIADQVATNLLFHFGPSAIQGAVKISSKGYAMVRGKGDVTPDVLDKISGRVARVWEDGKPHHYFVDNKGQLNKTARPVPQGLVEMETVADPKNPVYKQQTAEGKAKARELPLPDTTQKPIDTKAEDAPLTQRGEDRRKQASSDYADNERRSAERRVKEETLSTISPEQVLNLAGDKKINDATLDATIEKVTGKKSLMDLSKQELLDVSDELRTNPEVSSQSVGEKVQDTKGSDVPAEKGFEMKPTDTKPTLPPLTDNYRKPLSEYAPTLYRETNVAQAIDLLSGDSLDAKPFFSNTPNLAKGQGSNKGVTIELNSEGLQGQVNKKPGWEFTYQNGEAEFVGTYNKSYRDNVKSVTIDKASLPKSRRLYQYLEQSGFEKTKNSDGSITFARPRGAETSANSSLDSSASAEAISENAKRKNEGVESVVKVDTRNGKETPVIGPRPEDTPIKPYETIEFRGGSRNGEILIQGDKIAPNYSPPSRLEGEVVKPKQAESIETPDTHEIKDEGTSLKDLEAELKGETPSKATEPTTGLTEGSKFTNVSTGKEGELYNDPKLGWRLKTGENSSTTFPNRFWSAQDHIARTDDILASDKTPEQKAREIINNEESVNTQSNSANERTPEARPNSESSGGDKVVTPKPVERPSEELPSEVNAKGVTAEKPIEESGNDGGRPNESTSRGEEPVAEVGQTVQSKSPAGREAVEYGSKNKLYKPEDIKSDQDLLLKTFGGKGGSFGSNGLQDLNADVAKALARVAAFHVEAGARSFGDFSNRMLESVNDKIEPYLKELYAKVYAAHKDEFKDMEAPPERSDLTSNKNAVSDAERIAKGLDPAEHGSKYSNKASLEIAKTRLKTDPNAGRNIVARILDNPDQPISANDGDVVLVHKRQLMNDAKKFTEQLIHAQESGDLRAEGDARIALARTESELGDVAKANAKSGTAWSDAGRARQKMIDEDFEIGNLIYRKAQALGRKLSSDNPEDVKIVDGLREEARQYKEKADALEKKLNDIEDANAGREAKRYFDAAIRAMEKETTRKSKIPGRDYIKQKAQEARERQAAQGVQMRSGATPKDIVDWTWIVADHIAEGLDWVASLPEDVAKKLRPHFDTITTEAQKIYEAGKANEKSPKTPEEILAKARDKRINEAKKDNPLLTDEQAAKSMAESGELPNKQLVGQLIDAHLAQGKRGLDDVFNAVTKDVKDIYPDATRRNVEDAFSEYGKVKHPSQEELAVAKRELRRAAQLHSAITDAQEGIPPKKSGATRDKPTQTIREMQKELDAIMRRQGIEPEGTDQLASVNRARISALTNQIEDLNKQIATGEKPVKGEPVPTTAEVDALKVQRDALIKARDEKYPDWNKKEPMTDAQKNELRRKAIARKLGEVQSKLDAGDFSREVKIKTPDDPATIKARNELGKVVNEIKRRQAADDLKNSSLRNKAIDFWNSYRRFVVLSGIHTLGKLGGATLGRVVSEPLDRIAEHGVGTAFPRIAKAMNRDYGFRLKAESRGITQIFMKGLSDGWDMLKTGENELTRTYGEQKGFRHSGGIKGLVTTLKDTSIGKFEKGRQLSEGVMALAGLTHAIEKSPVKRGVFARNFELGMRKAIKNGENPHDELVQLRVGGQAYVAADRAILMNEHGLVKGYTSMLRGFEEAKNADGTPNLKLKAAASFFRTILPIVKVPMNYISETGNYVAGIPIGAGKIGWQYGKHYIAGKEIHPEDAESAIRSASKGIVGATLMGVGAAFPNVFGGYYTGKREDGDVEAGHIRIDGYDLPTWLSHNPLLEAMQFGATIRRVMDSKAKKSDAETQGLANGIVASIFGLAKQAPFLGESLQIAKVLDPNPAVRDTAVGYQLANMFVPLGLQQATALFDTDAQGNSIKRSPKGIIQPIEMGIPGLRQNVSPKNPTLTPAEAALVRESQLKHGQLASLIKMAEDNPDDVEIKDRLDKLADNKDMSKGLTPDEANRINKALGYAPDDPKAFKPTDGASASSDKSLPNFSKYNKSANGILERAAGWLEGMMSDPDAFEKLTGGETFVRLENGTIIVKRAGEDYTTGVKKNKGGTKAMTLDHWIPLELGGTNAVDNLRLVDKDAASDDDEVENRLAYALHDGKVTGKEAQKLIVDYKEGKLTADEVYKQIGNK